MNQHTESTLLDPRKLSAHRRWNRKIVLALCVFMMLVLAAELKYYFVERAIGHYLVWHNRGRERSGPTWERASSTIQAGSRLESISQQQRQDEKKLEEIDSFRDVVRVAREQQEVGIPEKHFQRIYARLPFFLKPLLVQPDSLIYFASRDMLDMVYILASGNDVELYMQGRQKEILFKAALSEEQIQMIAQHGRQARIDLVTDARFSPQRIFPVSRFLEKIGELTYDAQQRFLQALPGLYEHAAPNTRLAISNKISNGLIEIAIVTDNLRGYLYYIPEEMITDFVSVLGDDVYDDEDENIL